MEAFFFARRSLVGVAALSLWNVHPQSAKRCGGRFHIF